MPLNPGRAPSTALTVPPSTFRSIGSLISEPWRLPSPLASKATVNWPWVPSTVNVPLLHGEPQDPSGVKVWGRSTWKGWSAGAAPNRWLPEKMALLAFDSFQVPRPSVPATSTSRPFFLLSATLVTNVEGSVVRNVAQDRS